MYKMFLMYAFNLCLLFVLKGVKFEDFRNFCQLLNSLEDFGIAMTMYTIAGTPVTQEEFARAAKVCIGKSLNKEVISTVFDIFDVDGECVCVCVSE